MKRSTPLRRTSWPPSVQLAGAQRPQRIKPVAQPLARAPVYWEPANEAVVAAPKDSPERDEAYRRLVASLPCIRCGILGNSQAAHPNTGKGAGTKANDGDCFPLCCDRPGIRGCHSLFDQGALFTKAERRDAERAWSERTRSRLATSNLDVTMSKTDVTMAFLDRSLENDET